MTDQTRNVELVIRAKNLSKKTLDDVRKEIEEINKAIDDQVDASKRGQGSLKDLDKAYRDLESAMKSLVAQQSVIKQLEGQEAALGKLQAALDAASEKLRKHQEAMASTEKVTKRQAQQLATYEKAVTRSQAALDKQAERLAKTRTEAEALGIATDDLVGSQNRILNTGRRLSDVYDAQSTAVKEFASNVAQANRVADKAQADDTFARQAADAQKLVRAGDYVNFWVAELEKKEAVEKRMAADRAAQEQFTRQAADAQKLVKAADYVDFWTQSLNQLDAAQKRADDGAALGRLADQALAASRGYTTLGDASKRLVQNSRQVSATLSEILDPAAKVRSTLGGVEEEIGSLAAKISQLKGPVSDYRGQMSQLVAANKALANQAELIDSFQRQVAALREARTEFAQNRAALAQYAATLRSADAPTSDMQANLKRLEGSLAASARAFQQQVQRTREMRVELEQAGISSSNLAGAQARLVSAAKTSTAAVDQLGAAMRKYGDASDEANQKSNLFAENGRTTLSLVQRIRGEILALAAAYIGLQGSIGLANDALSASNTKQGIQNQLALSVGDDPKRIAEEYKYIRDQADRIGISFEDAAKGYAKFSAAASLAGRGNKEIRYVAESFLEVGRVANLSADDIGGVFKALEQIYSKGKIQAEELRGQLGDRLFGAFEIAAKALKDQYPSLDKAMKDGMVTSDQLLAIAEQYRKTVANRLQPAMESLASNQNRLNSEFFDFKVLIADSGFAKEYDVLVQRLIAFFKSDDGTKFAQGLSDAFGAVVSVLVFLIDHLDEIKIALELAFGLKAISLVSGLAAAIATNLLPMLVKLQAEFLTTGAVGASAMSMIRAAFFALAAAFVGWEIGKVLSDKFEIVRQLGVSLVIGFEKLLAQLKFAFAVVWVSVSTGAQNAFNKALGIITDFKNDAAGLLANLADSVGQEEFGKKIRGFISDPLKVETKDASAQISALKAQLDKDIAGIDAIGFEMFQDVSDAAKKAAEDSKKAADEIIQATAKPTIPIKPVDDEAARKKAEKEYERLVKKRIALAEELTRALEAAEGKIQKNEKLSLEERLKAIDTEYAKVFRKIDELAKLPGGAAPAAQMRASLQGYVQQLKAQETLKYNAEEMARREKAINDLISLRAQLLQTIAAQQKAGQLTDQQAKDAVAGVDARLNPQISAAVDAAKEFALANQGAFSDQTAMDTYIAKLEASKAGLVTTSDALYTVDQANKDIAGGLAGAFDSFAQSVANGENAIESARDAFLQFAADFLKKIALMIIQQVILNALQNSSIGGMIAGAASSAGTAGKNHSGGVIGSGGVGGTKVSVNPSWFANAPKYHTGGIAGLAPDEYPAILQRNEEVLTADDPRNVMNGGAAGGAAPAGETVNKTEVYNYVDAESFMSAALAKPRGQKSVMNVISANRSQIRQMLKG